MTGCDGAGMDTQIALGHRFVIVLAVLAAGLLWWCWPATDRAVDPSSVRQLVHWQDAAHDWLLVVDPETRELVVYDANDGRPLQRLGADDGQPEVHSIMRRGSLLLVTGRQPAKVRLLKLPQLQEVAFNAR